MLNGGCKWPDFVCVGSSKCGTTSLYEYLKCHPNIYLPEQKELHFFSSSSLLERPNGPGMKFVLADIIRSKEKYCEIFSDVSVDQIAGDISPSYLSDKKAADSIKESLGNPKIIIMLRNPVDKVFSQYLHLRRAAREKCSFEEALELEKQRGELMWGDMWLYQRSGYYYENVKYYIDLFGKDSVHIILSEKFKNETQQELYRLFNFLQIPSTTIQNTSQEFNVSALPKSNLVARMTDASALTYIAKKVIPRKYGSTLKKLIQNFNLGERPLLSEKTRERLLSAYKDDINKLESLLNIKTNWLG